MLVTSRVFLPHLRQGGVADFAVAGDRLSMRSYTALTNRQIDVCQAAVTDQALEQLVSNLVGNV
jgi:hypothetical protein